ncbi:MAG: restriction endonuclease subunit S, partial [Rhodospirillales bacterium]|nr:restriction endonuclease subunit S [Rhodospirillales bacterium]
QSSDDEPAFKQLERIAAKKSKTGRVARVKAGRAESSAPEETETPVPDGWEKTSLAELVTVLNGRAYSKDELLDAGTPVLRVGNLFTSKHWYYSNLELEPDKYCDKGDLIFAWSASFGPFIWPGPKVIYHYHIWKLELHSETDLHKGYLYWFLQNKTQEIKRAGHGVSMLHMTKEKMEKLEVMLPPLAEQRRIMAKVDELMALCDRLEAQQQERETQKAALARASLARFANTPTPANLEMLFYPTSCSNSPPPSSFILHPSSFIIQPSDLRKTILTLAVQGKLVPQNPNDGAVEEILVRIATTKLRLQKTGEIGKDKPIEPLQPDSLPFEAPESWRWAKLAELTELITKGSSPKWQGIAYVPESEGVLFITSENVGNYVLRKLDDLKYVAKGFNEIEPRSILKRGDILMNLVGASIGRTAVYDLHDGANINQAVALIRLVRETDGVCPRFLIHYLNSPTAIYYMLTSRVVNAQPNISLTDAREFAVPLPPLAEQHRIVAKVDQLMALVDALETQLAASRATAANLLSALVAELTAKTTGVRNEK